MLTLAGDNSGTLGDLNINATTGTAGIRLLNTSALTAGTFIINATGGLGQLYDDGSTTEKVFNGALQWGGPITSQQENMDFTGNMLLSDNLELRTGSANGRLEFSGNISDGGNGYGIDLNPDNTRSGRLVLSGTNTFTGNLKAEGGATSGTARIELNGSLSSSDITIGVRGILEGGGTIFFSDNDTIDVDGIMTATSMLFDTTSLGVTQMVLVDYAGGTFNGPGTIDDLLSPASLAAGWFLTDTGTQILAEVPVPEPSSLSLLGIGVGMMSARRRHQNQGSKRS